MMLRPLDDVRAEKTMFRPPGNDSQAARMPRLAGSTAALASMDGRSGLENSVAAWSHLQRLAVCNTSGEMATAA